MAAVHIFAQLLELETLLPDLQAGKLLVVCTILLLAVNSQRLGLLIVALATIYLSLHAYNRYLDSSMERTAKEALVILKSSSHSIDDKVKKLTKLKSEIKQRNIPDTALSTVFDATYSSISSLHSSLSAAGFATLSNLLKRLYLQEHYQIIVSNGRNFYPLLLERLGDHKEPIRSQAAQAFAEFWSAAPAEVEYQVLETALVGKNARAREASIDWLLMMTQEQDLRYRTYVPSLVKCLEDADSGVRGKAKAAVVELFSNVSGRAKSDLKKELEAHKVRKSIVSSVMSAIEQNEAAEPEPEPEPERSNAEIAEAGTEAPPQQSTENIVAEPAVSSHKPNVGVARSDPVPAVHPKVEIEHSKTKQVVSPSGVTGNVETQSAVESKTDTKPVVSSFEKPGGVKPQSAVESKIDTKPVVSPFENIENIRPQTLATSKTKLYSGPSPSLSGQSDPDFTGIEHPSASAGGSPCRKVLGVHPAESSGLASARTAESMDIFDDSENVKTQRIAPKSNIEVYSGPSPSLSGQSDPDFTGIEHPSASAGGSPCHKVLGVHPAGLSGLASARTAESTTLFEGTQDVELHPGVATKSETQFYSGPPPPLSGQSNPDFTDGEDPSASAGGKSRHKVLGVPPTVVGRTASARPAESTIVPDQSEKESRDVYVSPEEKKSAALASLANLVSPGDVKIEPRYVDSRSELEGIFREMAPHFEGRETEGNWSARDRSLTTLRRLVRGNSPLDYSHNFLGGIKTLLDGIAKTLNSLRTLLSTAGCYLVQDLARACGGGIDPFVEILLQNLMKLCGAMKKIAADRFNLTVEVLIGHVTYNSRILQHIWNACKDKNIQPRLYATNWLKIIITKQSRVKSSIEHHGGLETLDMAIKKGLADANAGVREGMRSTYWTFAGVWPEKAERLMATLDAKAKTNLEKCPDNPGHGSSAKQEGTESKPSIPNPKAKVSTLRGAINAQKAAMRRQPARPESAQSTFPEVKPTNTTSAKQEGTESKPSTPNPKTKVSALRGTINAQKAAMRRQPARPESAQSTFPEVKPTNTTSAIRPRPVVPTGSTSSSKPNSLSSAPMRPAGRPKMPEVPRPVSAGPYSARRPAPSGTRSQIGSPATSPEKTGATRVAPNKPKKLELPRAPPAEQDTVPTTTQPDPVTVSDTVVVSDPMTVSDTVSEASETPSAITAICHESPNILETASARSTPTAIDTSIRAVSSDKVGSGLSSDVAPQRGRVLSPRSSDIRYARTMVSKAIQKLPAGTVDIHGLKKLQTVITYHIDLFAGEENEKLHDGLLFALIVELETPPGDTHLSGPSRSVRLQVVVTMECMFQHCRNLFATFYPRVLSAFITSRGYFRSQDNAVDTIDRVIRGVVDDCKPALVIPAILDVVESTEENQFFDARVTIGVFILRKLFEKLIYEGATLTTVELERVSVFCRKTLERERTDLSQEVLELCLILLRIVPEETLFKYLKSAKRDYKSLIIYFKSRRE
ncbi:suppressor of tub2 mutation [Arachnomyces sp. PD_36]|nr:suppressor of tub2 mutation [Arachnomyces sp. PD_36]